MTHSVSLGGGGRWAVSLDRRRSELTAPEHELHQLGLNVELILYIIQCRKKKLLCVENGNKLDFWHIHFTNILSLHLWALKSEFWRQCERFSATQW